MIIEIYLMIKHSKISLIIYEFAKRKNTFSKTLPLSFRYAVDNQISPIDSFTLYIIYEYIYESTVMKIISRFS